MILDISQEEQVNGAEFIDIADSHVWSPFAAVVASRVLRRRPFHRLARELYKQSPFQSIRVNLID